MCYINIQYVDTVGSMGLLTCKNRRPYNLYCVGGDDAQSQSIKADFS